MTKKLRNPVTLVYISQLASVSSEDYEHLRIGHKKNPVRISYVSELASNCSEDEYL